MPLQIDVAGEVLRRSVTYWGDKRATEIVGSDKAIVTALQRAALLAASDAPALITGETGTGKELFARAMFLLSSRSGGRFVAVNSAQYHESQLIASELFGHRRGAFTGAAVDHAGVFEAAAGGVVFLDEVADLSLAAQAMVLRALSEREIVRVGETVARGVDVRVVAATNRDLRAMSEAGQFRPDLYYRLRQLRLHLPPLRERGKDWELLLAHFVDRLNRRCARQKRFSRDALVSLKRHCWPGNVRELRALVDTGFHLSAGETIESTDFFDCLESATRSEQLAAVPLAIPTRSPERLLGRMSAGEASFWDLVYRPFMDRELCRADVRALMTHALMQTRGSYKRALDVLGVKQEDYLRFMDFLRHHRLKPGDSFETTVLDR